MKNLVDPPKKHAAFIFIFITVVLDVLALGIIVPVLPKLILEFQGGDLARAASITGIFGFAWAGSQFIFSPVIGALSDRYGRRPVILLSNLGLGFDYIFMAIAPTMGWLFIGRIISGITSASFSTALAYIADVTPPEKRAASLGMLGAAFGLGFIIGPALGGTLGQMNVRLPFWVAAGLSLGNSCYGFFILPESLPLEKRSKLSLLRMNPFTSLKFLQSHRRLFVLSLATFPYYLAHESLPSVFVLYTDYRYHWNQREAGLALAAIGICSTLVSALLVGQVVSRMGERRTVLAGLLFGVLGFMCYGFAPSGITFLVGIPFVALWAVTGPALGSLLTVCASTSEQGRLQGALGSMRGITGMIGPLFFTQLFSGAVQQGQTLSLTGLPYLASSILLLLSLGVMVLLRNN